ncbi:MAG: DUF4194 domain-containing protein [Actinomycetota bacterium]
MTTVNAQRTEGPSDLSRVLVQLFKGPVYLDTHEKVWDALSKLRPPVNDYVGVLGLQLVVDESEGYAFLRSRPVSPDAEAEAPRLVARRSLSFHLSLLLALLRKRLAEFDASSSDSRLVMSRENIVEMLRVFMPETSNDARLVDNIDGHITKAVELGFLRRLPGDTDQFEVRRILKAFVDGQWLHEFDQRLDEYLVEFSRGQR